MNAESRDYNSISPSAEYLVRLKGFTRIPFAKAAAAILVNPLEQAGTHSFSEEDRKAFYKRLLHFENRYWTVERLLRQTNPQHILEISSGYSFRGLDWCSRQAVHFIDTDIPELVATKSKLIPQLEAGQPAPMKGQYELLPLNVIDTGLFAAIVNRFGEGPVSIVNEGLLMYLGEEEKQILCTTIRQLLAQRGGYWITGDIYVRTGQERMDARNEQWGTFRKQHKIDENMFESYEAARQLFDACGLEVVDRLALAIEDLSCLDFPGIRRETVLQKLESAPPTRESWCLRVKQ